LEKFLIEEQKNLSKVNSWSRFITTNFFDFLKNGKMIRGSLVLQSFLFFEDNISEEAIKLASAIELIHSSLLIHDDIMDKDSFRRGQKTIAQQFREIAQEEKFQNSEHFGNSMGISVGDLGFFLGFELLSQISKKYFNEISFLVSQELSKVTLAQMDDVYGGFSCHEYSKEKILSIYRYKTGRYSLSLPFMLGAILAGQSPKTITILENIGENMGVLFQIKDDKINLFGESEETGKPVGSDIRENKKTLYRHFLYEASSKKQKKELNIIFGNKDINISQVENVRTLVKELKVLEKIEKISDQLTILVKNKIEELNFTENKSQVLLDFLEYNLRRNK
jgi:geranylgeranyl diphosphate synthase type I